MTGLRTSLVALVISLLSVPALAGVGIFEYTTDVGDPAGIGSTVLERIDLDGTVYYLITAGGHDIWNQWDQFHYAYNPIAGDVRLEVSGEWVAAEDGWAKWGAMIRASTAGDAVNYMALVSKSNGTRYQYRSETGGYSDSWGPPEAAQRVAIQRVTVGDYAIVEGLADFGAGWESLGILPAYALPDEALVGVAVTAHRDDGLAQARVWDVRYDFQPALVAQLPTIPASAAIEDPGGLERGFNIRTIRAGEGTQGWGYDAMNELLDTGAVGGIPGVDEGTRQEMVVNLYDSGGRGAFFYDEEAGEGIPDQSFPGIDPFEEPAGDPAAGDNDDTFATEVTGYIFLTAGAHVIGANSDDGTIIEIGGVEIGRTEQWKGASNRDFLFVAEADGLYEFRARSLEGGGGSSLELHEVFPDGTRILLNDPSAAGSPVYIPEPATLLLLAPAVAVVMLRRRRRG